MIHQRDCRRYGSLVLWRAVLSSCLMTSVAGALPPVLDPEKSRVDVPAPTPPSVIEVNNAKQLFADDWVVEEAHGVRRAHHAVNKHPKTRC